MSEQDCKDYLVSLFACFFGRKTSLSQVPGVKIYFKHMPEYVRVND